MYDYGVVADVELGTLSGCAFFRMQIGKIMKKSYVLGAVIIVAILFWGYSCYSNSQARKAIVYVLEQDKHAQVGVSSIAEYVRNQSSISLLNCPSDFTMAYRRHQAAWQDMESVEEEGKYFQKRYNSGGAFLEAFLRGMVFDFGMIGDADEAGKRLRNHYQSANKAIKDTYREVLNIAESYGVETTSYR